MHLYLSQTVADEVRRRAELQGLTVSGFLASIVKAEMDDTWPPGYLEDVLDCPLERGEQGDYETRNNLE